jgi:hypothetical protein
MQFGYNVYLLFHRRLNPERKILTAEVVRYSKKESKTYNIILRVSPTPEYRPNACSVIIDWAGKQQGNLF